MTKIQRFKSYIQEVASAVPSAYVGEKDSDAEVKDYEPRSKGEKKFKDDHGKPAVQEYPGKVRQDGADKIKKAEEPKGKGKPASEGTK